MDTQELDLFPTENEGKSPKQETEVTPDFDNIFDRLSHSKFRSSFYLNNKDKEYIAKRTGAEDITYQADEKAKRVLTYLLKTKENR